MSSRHDSRHMDGDGGGESLPYVEYEDRDSHFKKHNGGEKERFRATEPDRGKDRDRRHKNYVERSGRDERRMERNDDDGRGNRDYSRRHGYDRDRGRQHRRRSRSASPDRSSETSRSRSKSKRTTGFDMGPPTAATLPGAVGQVLDFPQSMPGMLQNMFPFGASQLGALPLMPAQAMTQQATRHARRVYVGGLPPLANEQTIATFFSHIMTAIGGNSAGTAGDAVVNVYINHEKKFAFVEMRTVEEASNAMTLDGIIFEGVSVRVRRPTDYNPSLAAALGPSQPNPNLNLAAVGLTPGGIGGAEGPDRVFVGGLPYYFTEVQIRELLESFGPLRGFDLVKDRDTGNSKGYGFCVYEDQAVTDVACAALNGLKMGDKTLTVRRATMSGQMKSEQDIILAQAQQHIAMQKMALQIGGFNLPGAGVGLAASHEVPTKILCLTEVITADDLMDDGEYEEILEDMREEGRKFGDLINVVIPRPNPNGDQVHGLGKVFLEYGDIYGCGKAKDAMGGRKFGGNVVTATYYPEHKYLEHDYGA